MEWNKIPSDYIIDNHWSNFKLHILFSVHQMKFKMFEPLQYGMFADMVLQCTAVWKLSSYIHQSCICQYLTHLLHFSFWYPIRISRSYHLWDWKIYFCCCCEIQSFIKALSYPSSIHFYKYQYKQVFHPWPQYVVTIIGPWSGPGKGIETSNYKYTFLIPFCP